LSQHLDLSTAELIQAVRAHEAQLKIPLLRAEAHVLAMIKSEPGHAVKFYLNKSELSSRWFHKILGELLNAGLISEARNPNDSRQKILT
jgi:DNA-binding MarR family transcriptional regulator